MEILNRTEAPVYKTIEKIEIPEPKVYTLKNGLPLYYINDGTQEVIRIELCFNAGYGHESQRMQANASFNLLNSGTATRTSMQIAEDLDYYGSYLELSPEKENSYITLYSLNKYLNNVLPVFADVLSGAIYPGKEIDTYKQNAIQKLNVNNQKVSNRSARRFNQVMFGENNPFGYAETEADLQAITPELLQAFYTNYIKSGSVSIIVAGKVGPEQLAAIDDYIGGLSFKAEPILPVNSLTPIPTPELSHRVEMEGTVQCAIRIGKMAVNKPHPDYQALKILNTLLGGYFGSRLMSNIREDKGYTYGIGSWIISRKDLGYFAVSTEVGADVYQDALSEIYYEIDLLTTELIEEDELEVVRNYKMGSLLKGFDGPFSRADKLRGLLNYGLNTSYYDGYIKKILTIKPEELNDVAKRYLQAGSFYEVVAGKI